MMISGVHANVIPLVSEYKKQPTIINGKKDLLLKCYYIALLFVLHC